MKRLNQILLVLLAVIVVNCTQGKSRNHSSKISESHKTCTFTNPVGKGQDPWVIKHNGYYYFIESKNGGIYISKNKKLTQIKKNEKLVWKPPAQGWNHANIWAPELHYINGHWFIYYAAAKKAGSPFIYQRSGVLEARTANPQGSYKDMGMLYTGNHIRSHKNNIWAIDLTVTRIHNQLYAIWSGWKQNEQTDKTPQNLYMAKMKNPWTISSNRVVISEPKAKWELGPQLNLEEGPEVLKHAGHIFIIYSTRDSWLRTYCLGQLELKNKDENPMVAQNWTKKGPVFKGTNNVYGTGHASFTTSPDGTQHWIIFHSKVDTTPGWNREIDMKHFTWNTDGSPYFGIPVPPGKSIKVPSGQCK